MKFLEVRPLRLAFHAHPWNMKDWWAGVDLNSV